jgi:hypothetical protein
VGSIGGGNLSLGGYSRMTVAIAVPLKGAVVASGVRSIEVWVGYRLCGVLPPKA